MLDEPQKQKPKDDEAAKAKQQAEDLEEGLEESFPASDPPAATQPGEGGRDDKGKTGKS